MDVPGELQQRQEQPDDRGVVLPPAGVASEHNDRDDITDGEQSQSDDVCTPPELAGFVHHGSVS
jgi:hypothetical protein